MILIFSNCIQPERWNETAYWFIHESWVGFYPIKIPENKKSIQFSIQFEGDFARGTIFDTISLGFDGYG